MQVILSENEYNNLLEAKSELFDLKNKVHKAFKVDYNKDGNFLKNIHPTLKSITAYKDHLIDLIYVNYEYREDIKKMDINIK